MNAARTAAMLRNPAAIATGAGATLGRARPRRATPCLNTRECKARILKIERLILDILDETLCLNGRARFFDMDTPLLGHLPELDSMAVVALISALEEKLKITIEYGDINAANFATVQALTDFARGKVGELS